jgi:hypothetical protein
MIQRHAQRIFLCGEGCRLSGHGEAIVLRFPGEQGANAALDSFLSQEHPEMIFWGFDVGLLAEQLSSISSGLTLVRPMTAAVA